MFHCVWLERVTDNFIYKLFLGIAVIEGRGYNFFHCCPCFPIFHIFICISIYICQTSVKGVISLDSWSNQYYPPLVYFPHHSKYLLVLKASNLSTTYVFDYFLTWVLEEIPFVSALVRCFGLESHYGSEIPIGWCSWSGFLTTSGISGIIKVGIHLQSFLQLNFKWIMMVQSSSATTYTTISISFIHVSWQF